MVTDIGGCVSEIGETECRDHVPHTEEADLRVRLHDIVGAGPADAVALDFVAEIQRRRGAAAEADDVDDPIVVVHPLRAEMLVRLVDARPLTHAEEAADDLANGVPACADASNVEICRVRSVAIGLGEAEDVGIRQRVVVACLPAVPRAIKCVKRHEVLPLNASTIVRDVPNTRTRQAPSFGDTRTNNCRVKCPNAAALSTTGASTPPRQSAGSLRFRLCCSPWCTSVISLRATWDAATRCGAFQLRSAWLITVIRI